MRRIRSCIERPRTGLPSMATIRSPGTDPDARCGRALDGRDDDDRLVAEIDLDADATEFALRVGLEDPVVLLRQVRRVRIELGDHALDGAFEQSLAIDRIDILVFHEHEDSSELAHQVVRAFARTGELGDAGHSRAGQDAKNDGPTKSRTERPAAAHDQRPCRRFESRHRTIQVRRPKAGARTCKNLEAVGDSTASIGDSGAEAEGEKLEHVSGCRPLPTSRSRSHIEAKDRKDFERIRIVSEDALCYRL